MGDLRKIVHQSEAPCPLSGTDKTSLPVERRSNGGKAWVTSEVFQNWYTNNFCPSVKAYSQAVDSG